MGWEEEKKGEEEEGEGEDWEGRERKGEKKRKRIVKGIRGEEYWEEKKRREEYSIR